MAWRGGLWFAELVPDQDRWVKGGGWSCLAFYFHALKQCPFCLHSVRIETLMPPTYIIIISSVDIEYIFENPRMRRTPLKCHCPAREGAMVRPDIIVHLHGRISTLRARALCIMQHQVCL